MNIRYFNDESLREMSVSLENHVKRGVFLRPFDIGPSNSDKLLKGPLTTGPTPMSMCQGSGVGSMTMATGSVTNNFAWKLETVHI